MLDQDAITITKARRDDARIASSVLARAFQDDPVFEWLLPDPDRRRDLLPSVFTAFSELYLPYDEVYIAGSGLGVALWAPPASQPFSEEELDHLGEQLAVSLGDDAAKAAELDATLEEHHPEEPAFFLQFMGVIPEQQGRGLGSRLLETVLERCDAEGTPALLDATSPDNRRLYERHGFETIAPVDVARGPTLWTMWREPERVEG